MSYRTGRYLEKAECFGFSVAMNSLTPVWLQKPVEAGGYGFTPIQNALCKWPPYLLRSLYEGLTAC